MSEQRNSIPFVKATACGNDFLIIDGALAPENVAGFTRQICDRHAGVGADGVEWLFPAADADVEARLWNADGSKAEISGNGTRCVAAYLCFEEPREKVVIRTGAGLKTCTLTSRRDRQYEFEIAMGEPLVGNEVELQVDGSRVRGFPVSMGNPHFVLFVEEFPSNWQARGAAIQRHPDFTEGVNVEFVTVKDRENLEARFFERGAGETLSSGTGSCASAVAAIASQRAISPVRVHAPGGTQVVRWDGAVFLRGTAAIVCRGEFLI